MPKRGRTGIYRQESDPCSESARWSISNTIARRIGEQGPFGKDTGKTDLGRCLRTREHSI